MSDYDENFSVRDKNSHSIQKISNAHSKTSRKIFTLVNYNCNLSVISSEQMIFIIEWICWLFGIYIAFTLAWRHTTLALTRPPISLFLIITISRFHIKLFCYSMFNKICRFDKLCICLRILIWF